MIEDRKEYLKYCFSSLHRNIKKIDDIQLHNSIVNDLLLIKNLIFVDDRKLCVNDKDNTKIEPFYEKRKTNE